MADVRKFGPLTVRERIIKGKPTGKWFVDIPSSMTSTGKRVRKLYASFREAETVAREVAKELRMQRLGFARKVQRSNLTFTDAVDRWLASRELDAGTCKLRESSLRTIHIRIKPLSAYFGRYSISDIGSDEVSRYQLSRLQAGRNPSTVNGETRILRQILGWLKDEGHLEVMPKCRAVNEEYRRYEIPSMEDAAKLIGRLSPMNRALIRLMAETGLRPGEALNLPWEHLEAKKSRIWIGPHRGWAPKTKASHRYATLREGVLADILALPRTGDYIFAGKDPKKPLQNVRTALNTAAKAVGIRRPSLKLFRKAFATWQAENGLHPALLQQLMGHAQGSKVTDQHYIFASEVAKQAATLSLPLPERGAA